MQIFVKVLTSKDDYVGGGVSGHHGQRRGWDSGQGGGKVEMLFLRRDCTVLTL